MKFSATLGGLATLGLLTACGGPSNGTPKAIMLSPEGANQQAVAFSPDGKRVAFWDASSASAAMLNVAATNDVRDARTLDSATTAAGTPIWSPDGSTLAYFAGPNLDIWVVPTAGGTPRRLTTSKGIEEPIQWHPLGDRLAFVATGKGGAAAAGQIDVASGNTNPIVAETRLTLPFWSPDGTKIAYMLVDGSQRTLWVADSAGRNATQLTAEGFERFLFEGTDPWSPDGSEIVYESDRTGFGDIWTVSVTTDSMHQLTRDVRADYAPSWSPDGKWVVFLSDRGHQTDIWIVPAAGGTPLRVTDDASVEANVQWVPGTNAIGFTTGSVQQGMWETSLADTTERRVTPDSIQMGLADLSPDGKTLVFVNIHSGNVRDLDIMSVSGGPPRVLVANGAANMAPEWSPDGSKIVYLSTKTGNQDVWVVDTAGGAPTDLTPWPTNEREPTWARDGSSVYVMSNRENKQFYDLWQVGASGGTPRRLTNTDGLQGVMVSRATGDVFVRSIGGSEGQVVLDRVLPDGKLVTLWDKSNVLSGDDRGFIMPSGDSIAFFVAAADGGFQQMLMSTHGGNARPLLPENNQFVSWAPDGTHGIAGSPQGSLYLFSRTDSTAHQLVKKGDNVAFVSPDGKTVLYQRSTTISRIATVDASGLMTRKP